jgi:4-hydroxy-tetrahydrodipicolinate synthase
MVLTNANIITALVTPFDKEGNIDFDKLPVIIEHLLSHHTEGLILAGTTGESPTLTHDEEIDLFKRVIKIVDGRVPLICGVGTNDTRDSVEFVKEVAEMGGIDAGLAVVPYYNKPNQEGLYQHFKAIAEASDLPIVLYNVPGRTVASLDVETTLRLAELPNIIAIKECAGLDAITELVEQAPKDFLVYTGEDSLAFASKAVGGQGIISVAAHVLGNEMFEMYSDLENGDIKKAAAIQRKILPKMNALFSAPSPAPVKAVLKAQGIDVGGLRLPLVAVSSEQEEKILSIFNK